MNRLSLMTDIVRTEIPEGSVKDKLCYFIEYYSFACDQMEKNMLDEYPLYPHVILRILKDELQNRANGRNLQFLKESLNKVKGKDFVCREYYGYLIDQVIQFVLSDETYTLHICRELLDRMERGAYAKQICTRMEDSSKRIREYMGNLKL